MFKLSRIIYYAVLCAMVVSLVACNKGAGRGVYSLSSDSLCNDMLALRHVGVQRLHSVAIAMDTIPQATVEQHAVAKNSLAYVTFMRMDYSKAMSIYDSIIDVSPNEIESLIAEVGMMQVCYRTSSNKEFFDYRSNAIRRIKRINEEVELLSPKNKKRFISAKVEFAIISHCYFANLGMYDEMQRTAKFLRTYMEQTDEPVLRMYARMVLNYGTDVPVEKCVESLCRLHERAEKIKQTWLCANTRLMLALLLRDGGAVNVLSNDIQYLRTRFLADTVAVEELPLQLALKAIDGFREYGDRYMMIEAMAVAASCNTFNGYFDEAVALLEEAMNEINIYYSSLDNDKEFQELSLYSPGDSIEWELLNRRDIYNIYECLLSVRHEANCAFAGIGDKYLSDINRNSYLDLLNSTRLNKQVESRIKAAENNAAGLYVWLAVVLILLLVFIPLTVCLNIRWRRHNVIYLNDLVRVLKVCRVLMSSMPQELADENDVYNVVSAILNKELACFWKGVSFIVLPAISDKNDSAGIYVYDFKLQQIDDKSHSLLRVFMSDKKSYTEKRDMIHILLPYISVAIDEGKRIANIDDEQLKLEQQRVSYSLYLAEHKRENVEKRTIMSVVNGMRPYMNRMLNELSHLAQTSQKGDAETRRLAYLSELTIILDDYNAALEHWIKMRSGELSLHIENFKLSELLAIIAKGRQAFAMKGITLLVDESDAVVKADKALTLFMMNTLVDNAGKFTDCGGTVRLSVVKENDYVEIAITDTGRGMSADEVYRLQNDKIYMYNVGNEKSGDRKKGGFGLMNCKGIIDKYRKTDDLFSICRMDILSEQGKGSRISFRLPKGVRRGLLSLLFLLLPYSISSAEYNFDRIDTLTDSVYTCNVRGEYDKAIYFAGQAITELNNCYIELVGGSDTISLYYSKDSEVKWWRDNLFQESMIEHIYYNLLDIRNEVAVAALSVKDWSLYRYNNSIYVLLYRLVHEDKELVLHYEKMQDIANYRYAAVAVCVTLLFVLLVVYMVMYVRHVVMERMNTRMLLNTNLNLLKAVDGGRSNIETIAEKMASEIYSSMRELLRVESVFIFLKHDTVQHYAVYPGESVSVAERYVYNVYETATPYFTPDGTVAVLPLTVLHSGEQLLLGVIALDCERKINGKEIVTLELVAGYAASMLYYSTVCLVAKYDNLDEIEEEMERVKYEENNLHVRNLVLDNCLSVIKHETIYYPGRMRKLVQQFLDEDNNGKEWCNRVAAIKELMDYYNSIFNVLGECAMRQLDDIGFSYSLINMNDIALRMKQLLQRKAIKGRPALCLQYEPVDVVMNGDKVLVDFLFESVFRSLLSVPQEGEIRMCIGESDLLVNVEIIDTRRHLSQNEIDELFVPVGKTKENSTSLGNVGFLIAKEIIRIHEDNTDKRGGRIEVFDSEQGLVIMFALPK